MRRHLICVTIVAMTALALPTVAAAATTSYNGDTLTFTSDLADGINRQATQIGNVLVIGGGGTPITDIPPTPAPGTCASWNVSGGVGGFVGTWPALACDVTGIQHVVAFGALDFAGSATTFDLVVHAENVGAGEWVGGTAGNDIIYGGVDTTIRAAGGDDVVHANGGSAWGEGGNDVIDTTDRASELSGGAGDDQVHGGPAADHITVDAGHDTVWAGAGDDYIAVYRDAAADTVHCGAGSDTVIADSIDTLDACDHETVDGLGENDIIVGGSGDDTLRGHGGADHITGGKGPDLLDGGTGNDTLNARDGRGGDVVRCGKGTDTARIDRGDKTYNCERVRTS